MLDAIVKLPFNKASNIGIVIFGGFIAPFWFIFQFFPYVYNEENLIKLIFICLSIGSPLLLLNFISTLASNRYDRTKKSKVEKEKEFIGHIVIASLASALVFYLPCCLGYFIDVSPKQAIVWLIIGQVGTFISDILVYQAVKRKNKQSQLEVEVVTPSQQPE